MKPDRLHALCGAFLRERRAADPAHDIQHVERVVDHALHLSDIEGAEIRVVLPAAWLHDCVTVSKDSPERPSASRLAAAEAVAFLQSVDYPQRWLEAIRHAIEAHSFSSGIQAETLEARVVQDADRLDALGAVGIARCLLTGGAMGTPLYASTDPFCSRREPDDRQFTLDHFYRKLLHLPATMQTAAGRAEAERRADYMQRFLARLREEINGAAIGG